MFDGLPTWGNTLILPVLHYRLEFADAVRIAIERWQPDALVVELPPTLEPQIRRAVGRLPQMSVIVYLSAQGEPVYLPVEPCDALLEAVRSGAERDLPVAFADVDMDEYGLDDTGFPDPYAVARLGLAAYWHEYAALAAALEPTEADRRREANLAWQVQRSSAEHERVLLVCGLAHVRGVLAALAQPQAQQLQRVKREHVQIFNVHPDSARQIMATLPLAAAVYELRRRSLPEAVPTPPLLITEHVSGLRMVSTGLQTQAEQTRERSRLATDLARLGGLVPSEAYSPLDRQKVLVGLVEAARRGYEEHTGEQLAAGYLRTWLQFCRRYARVKGRLLPDLFELVVGARGIADDNLAYEVWDLGSEWPWQHETAEFQTVQMSPDELWLGSQRIRFRPRVQRTKRRLHPVALRERKGEKRPGEWRREFRAGGGICSYPPEDLLIEDFGRHLQRRAKHQLAEDDARVEPFSSSLLDGVDVRETVRNWFQGTLYVKELRRIRGDVGAVVVIFDEDHTDHFPWRMTWLGEHDQESDMAFYSTSPDHQVVGPGIARCEYGGFMMSYPPGRLDDIWMDPDYLGLVDKPEVLLSAALDYSLEKHVVYVAAKPPRSAFRTWAGRLGRQVCYLPIGGLSPVTLKKLRVFHVLSGHDKRAVAREFIW